jgi:hypothetical protein
VLRCSGSCCPRCCAVHQQARTLALVADAHSWPATSSSTIIVIIAAATTARAPTQASSWPARPPRGDHVVLPSPGQRQRHLCLQQVAPAVGTLEVCLEGVDGLQRGSAGHDISWQALMACRGAVQGMTSTGKR